MLAGVGSGADAQGVGGWVVFRPVEPTPPVGPREAEPRATSAVTDAAGRAVSPAQTPLDALTREKRALLDALRGREAPSQTGASSKSELSADPEVSPNTDASATAEGSSRAEGGGKAESAEQGAASKPSEARGDGQLSEGERAQVQELKARDREVRAHEQAHATVGGQYAGAPSYTYQVGPDGQRYAIGGEVAIDVSPIPGDPDATVEKMRIVERAALAPAEPSPQDRKVAQFARAQGAAASAEAAALAAAERRGEGAEANEGDGSAIAQVAAATGYADAREAGAERKQPVFSLAA